MSMAKTSRCDETSEAFHRSMLRVEELKRRHTVDALASAAEEGRGHATKRLGEQRACRDPRESEWGNPTRVIPRYAMLNT